MSITSEAVLRKMNEIQSKGGEPIGHWHQLRHWLLEDEQVKETFQEAVANDAEMSAEQKEHWLDQGEYKLLYDNAVRLLNAANHKLARINGILLE
jgi:hypothetical protein